MGPSAQEVHLTMTSALAARLEGIHELPDGVLLAHRDKLGRWGPANAYFAYCHRCRSWLDFAAGMRHTECSGEYWDRELADAAWRWWWEVERLSERVRRGEHPYCDGLLDLRGCTAAEGSRLPALREGRRQLLRGPPADGLESRLEVMVDVPADLQLEGVDEPCPLRVLLYFHGHGGETCHTAPSSLPGCAVVAVQCPQFVTDGLRCFWFIEGPGGAWTKHEHSKLKRCEAMLAAVSDLLEAVLAALELLCAGRGVERRLLLLGVSMGGSAVLEFARRFPERTSGAAVVSGHYDTKQVDDLARDTAAVPLLLVHNPLDRACPFSTIEELHRARVSEHKAGAHAGDRRVRPRVVPRPREARAAAALTEAWFSAERPHSPTNEQLLEPIQWLLRHGT